MNALIERLGWMLLHSLWEGAVVWLLLQAALIVLRKKSAQTRYLAACFALAATALLPWMTFGSMDLSARLRSAHPSSVPALVPSEKASSVSPPAVSSDVASIPHVAAPLEAFVPPEPRESFVEAFLPWLVGGWALGVAVFACRLWISWRSVRRLARMPVPELPAAWRRRLGELCRTAGVRSIVRAGETAAVVVPLVVGWLKPVILLPLGVLAQLPAEQVEAILLHELAHIRRHDFLVNLLQNVVETLFFYHPAVRSISRRIREERERVCDDLSVEWCRNPVVYAEALTTFEEFRRQSLALAVTGEGDLLARVRRIVLGVEPRQQTASIIAVAGFLATGVYLASMFLAPLLAAELMTDKERVAKIQALQTSPVPEDWGPPGGNVSIKGTLKTMDGQPLPKSLFDNGLHMKSSEAMVVSSNMGTAMSGNLDMDDGRNQKFYCWASQPGQTGRIEIGIWAEGYAPLRQNVVQTKGDEIKVDLVLKGGFPARLQVIGSNGQPLKDVVVTATFPRPGGPLQLSMPQVQTDANGFATFGKVEANSEIHLVASKPGWQIADQVVSEWSDQAALVWKLEPAKSTSGRVIDQVTRKPVSGAEIILAARRAAGDSQFLTYGPENGQVLGHTDSNGHFDLENLSKNASFRIYIQAAGYPTATFPIEYGDQNRTCELTPGLHIRGKILDPQGLLTSKSTYYPIEIECMYTIQATPFYGIGQNQRKTLSKLGSEIPFSFDNLPKGGVSLILPGKEISQNRHDLDLEKNIDDYVIDLSAKSPEDWRDTPDRRPLRTVEVTLKTPDGTSPAGSLESWCQTTVDGHSWSTQKILSISAGKATTEFPVPTKIDLNANHLVGYWFTPESFALPAGTKPFTHTVNVIAAGVIHGHVTLPPSLKKRQLSISVMVIEPPAGTTEAELSGGGSVILSADGDYVTPPLPFGGAYAAILDAGPSYFVCAPAVVDARHPIVVRDLDATVASDTLKGKFVDEAKKPLAHQEIMLTYHPAEHQAMTYYAAATDGDGSFTISNLNFAVPGNYEVQIFGNEWDQTKVRIDGHTPQPVIISVRHRTK